MPLTGIRGMESPVPAVSSIIALIQYYAALWVGYGSVVRVSASYSTVSSAGSIFANVGRVSSF